MSLVPMAAYASFGGGGSCQDFGCYFLLWGLIIGVAGGIPASVALFIPMHIFLCNPARSKYKQALLGGILAVVTFELAAACASIISLKNPELNPWIGFALVYAVSVVLAALYARSSPREGASA